MATLSTFSKPNQTIIFMAAKTKESLNLTFEQSIEELEKIVQKLEGGKGKLEEAISDYERGTVLKNHCENKLKEAEAKIQKIILGKNGLEGLAPLDQEE
jgi:exodeoxyribonuclease VII small subunit